jgi:hypothetical protein
VIGALLKENMADLEHLKILEKGLKEWNLWRKNNPKTTPDLGGAKLCRYKLSGFSLGFANLIGADLSEADLSFANLIKADLSRAILYGADLSNAGLSGAILYGTYFRGANFRRTDLSGANLRMANLYGTDLSGAKFDEASLTEATLVNTTLNDIDLSSVKGLDTVKHEGPSSIGIDTFFRSQGKIPEVFLRGCGVPDIFIEYAASLVGKTFDFYSCFISYSTKDQDFADRLHADLQSKGVRCWLASENLKIGDKFRVTIDETIRVYDKLLLVLSEHSVQSDWVEKEVETAMEREREQKRTMLFPIRLDDAVMDIKTGWPADVRRTRHIGDFRNWKDHDAYQKAFTRLLRDLKADAAPKKP